MKVYMIFGPFKQTGVGGVTIYDISLKIITVLGS
jgi:hypothetical protein